MAVVYRIEDPKTQDGVYQSRLYRKIGHEGDNTSRTPCIKWDYSFDPHADVVYGFRSKAQMFDWFTKGEVKKLQKVGAVVKKLSVPKDAIRYHNKQVLFDRGKVEKTELLGAV